MQLERIQARSLIFKWWAARRHYSTLTNCVTCIAPSLLTRSITERKQHLLKYELQNWLSTYKEEDGGDGQESDHGDASNLMVAHGHSVEDTCKRQIGVLTYS